MTTTMKKPTPSLAARLASERRDLLDAAEQECSRLADGDEVTPDAQMVFDALQWSKEDVRRETGRLEAVRAQQVIAGTTEEREKASEAAATAEKTLAEKRPAIEAQLAKLQGELRSLEATAANARRKVEQQQAAVTTLRQFVPKHIREQANARWKLGDAPAILGDIREITARIDSIKSVLAIPRPRSVVDWPPLPHEQLAAEHAKNAEREDLLTELRLRNGYIAKLLNSSAWSMYLTELEDELPDLEQNLTFAERAKAGIDAEIERLLDFYCR